MRLDFQHKKSQYHNEWWKVIYVYLRNMIAGWGVFLVPGNEAWIFTVTLPALQEQRIKEE